jgi:hypothetical protein
MGLATKCTGGYYTYAGRPDSSHVTPRTPPLPARWRGFPAFAGRPSRPERLIDTFCFFFTRRRPFGLKLIRFRPEPQGVGLARL